MKNDTADSCCTPEPIISPGKYPDNHVFYACGAE
jgi:hypothetical protein